jgi:hypothetical protein
VPNSAILLGRRGGAPLGRAGHGRAELRIGNTVSGRQHNRTARDLCGTFYDLPRQGSVIGVPAKQILFKVHKIAKPLAECDCQTSVEVQCGKVM